MKASKIRAKYLPKSPKVPKKQPKKNLNPKTRRKSPKSETKQAANHVKPKRLSKQHGKSELPCKNRASPKFETNKNPCKSHAKTQVRHKQHGKQPGKSRNLARNLQGRSISSPKLSLTQDEASQNGAQKSLPSYENSPANAQGWPERPVSKGPKTLVPITRTLKSKKLGTKLARGGECIKPAKPKKQTKHAASRLIKKLKAQPKLGSKEFKALQVEWYKKLEASGFKDLEPLHDLDGLLSSKGLGHQSTAALDASLNSGRDLYYRRLTNFVTHNPNWSASKLYNLVGQLYVEGVSYRKMLPQIYRNLKIKTNIWVINKIVCLLRERSNSWNKSHHNGIDFQPDLETEFSPLVKS